MKEYTEIRSDKALQKFLNETVSFHDSILKEMQIINRGYVSKNKSMNMCHQLDARILFQTQWEPVAFELLCANITHLNVTGPELFMGSCGSFTKTSKQKIELSLDGEFVIECEKFFYKLSPEFYGNNEHLGSQVATTEMVSSEILKDNWRQCGNCSDAWEVSNSLNIATCPSCNKVTCLNFT